LAKYLLVSDCGPDGDKVWLTIWFPKFHSRPRVHLLRAFAKVYALAEAMNAKAQQRFGLDVVTARIEDDEGKILLTFEIDDDFSDSYNWRDELAASATRIIEKHGGVARRQ
jgi:hypothetical protein